MPNKPNEVELTPENYARFLREAQSKLGEGEGRDLVHSMALNQGFSMNGNAIVRGIKWVKGEVHKDGVLVQGLHAEDPFQLTMFKNA